MGKKTIKKVMIGILCVFAFFSSILGIGGLTNPIVRAEEYDIDFNEWIQTQEATFDASELIQTKGLTATYNKVGIDLNESLINDTRAGILFTADKLGVDAEGSCLVFKRQLTGAFEIDFRVFSDQTDTNPDWAKGGAWQNNNTAMEIREVAITITDEDSKESFTVYVAGGVDYAPFLPTARVGYGDVGENTGVGLFYERSSDSSRLDKDNGPFLGNPYNTYLYGTSFSNRARNNNGFIGAGYPTCIGFDPETKEVYGYNYGTKLDTYCYKRVILNLSDSLHLSKAGDKKENLKQSSFENYSIKMTITDVANDKPAKFLLYGINGQRFAGKNGQIVKNSGLLVKAELPSDGIVNKAYKIPAPTAHDMFEGQVQYNGNVKVVYGKDTVVLEETPYTAGMTFTPTKTGDYKIIYLGGTDINGNIRKTYSRLGFNGAERTEVLSLNIVDKNVPLSLMRTEQKNVAIKGIAVDVGAKGVSQLDKLDGGSIAITLSITKDGNPYANYTNVSIFKNEYVTFDQSGSYHLTYNLTDYVGQTAQENFDIMVNPFYATLSSENDGIAYYGEDYFVGKGNLFVSNKNGIINDYELAVEVNDGTNWQSIVSNEQGLFNLKQMFVQTGAGEQTVRFQITLDNETMPVEYTVYVRDIAAPTLIIGNLQGDAKENVANSTEKVKEYRINKGGNIVVPSVSVQDNMDKGNIPLEIIWKTPSQAQLLTSVGTSLSLDELGVYYLVYKATDSSENVVSCIYKIEARNLWFDIQVSEQEFSIGTKYVPIRPTVKNFMTDELISEYDLITEVTFRGETLAAENGAYSLDKAGVYSIKYIVTCQGQIEEYETTFNVKDTIKPTITIDGKYDETVKINTVITLLSANAQDNNQDISVEVFVLYNGLQVAVEDNSFKADQVGIYTIVYVAEDEAGNITEEIIEIKVEGEEEDFDSCKTNALYISLISVGVAVIAFVVIIIIRKTRKKNNKKTNKEKGEKL